MHRLHGARPAPRLTMISQCRLPPSRGSKGRRAHSAPAGDRHDSCSLDPAGCAPGYAQSARARQPLPAAAQTPRGPSCTAWSPRDHAAAHSRPARTAGSRPTWAEPLPAVQAMSAVTGGGRAESARCSHTPGCARLGSALPQTLAQSPGWRSPQLRCRAESRRSLLSSWAIAWTARWRVDAARSGRCEI